jgi:4-hydroxybenzoate polyprenyltransferase
VAAVLALLAFGLVLMLNALTVALALAAALIAVSYPFTKRFFPLPQAYLGVAFSFGIPMAYAALLGRVPAEAWGLLAANMLWTVAYDTEYAMVDREDDRKLGIRTAALLFGRYDVLAVMLCHAGFLAIMTGIGWAVGLGWPYYIGLAGAAVLAAYQYTLIRRREAARCFEAFLHNNWIGAAVFVGIALALPLGRTL